MKSFNKIITVQVSVDSIAQQLLGAMSPDFKHSEMVTEAIVGTLLDRDRLGVLYNTLNGFSVKINFELGDEIIPSPEKSPFKVYAYWTPESIQAESTVLGEVKLAKVIEINEYADKKLRIEFDAPQKDGTIAKEERWVNHLDWDRIPVPSLAEVE